MKPNPSTPTPPAYEQQIERWLAGESIHGEQCCPDFSCCKPELLAPESERRLFVERADLREKLCMGFLGRALALMGKGEEVHIAGSIEGSA